VSNELRGLQLLGISGSLRRASFATAILKSVDTMLGERASISHFDLGQIPLYNQDLDGDDKPASVVALKSTIERCDGLVVSSPEYNYSIPGVLKNAIDWASRPGFNSVLKGKPVLYMTSSPGAVGGARAQVHLLELFSATLSRVVAAPHITVAAVGTKVHEGRLADAPTIEFIGNAIDALLREIAAMQASRR
jgi:chromate reductase